MSPLRVAHARSPFSFPPPLARPDGVRSELYMVYVRRLSLGLVFVVFGIVLVSSFPPGTNKLAAVLDRAVADSIPFPPCRHGDGWGVGKESLLGSLIWCWLASEKVFRRRISSTSSCSSLSVLPVAFVLELRRLPSLSFSHGGDGGGSRAPVNITSSLDPLAEGRLTGAPASYPARRLHRFLPVMEPYGRQSSFDSTSAISTSRDRRWCYCGDLKAPRFHPPRL